MTNSSLITSIASEYVDLLLPIISDFSLKSASQFKQKIALESQGEDVQLFDNGDIKTMVLAFSTLFDIAQEIVFKLKSGQSILILDNNLSGKIRQPNINTGLWRDLSLLNENMELVYPTETKETAEIDMAELWPKFLAEGDIIPATEIFIKSFPKYNKRLNTIFIKGEIPSLPAIVAVYLSRLNAEKVVYIGSDGSQIKLFN